MSTAGGLADLHPEPGPGRAASDDDPLTPLPEDDSSVISLPPLATFTRGDASPVAWESEPRSSYGRRERSGLLSEAADDGLQVSSESGSPGGSRRGGMPPPPPPEPPVSRAQVAVIGLACFCTFGMGGVVFGISSLYPVLYAQGYWRAICNEAAASVCTGHSTKCCEAQLVRYSLVASVAFFSVDVASAPWGVLADRAGARACLAAAVALSAFGFLLLGGGAAARSDEITTAALLLLGLAGPGVFNGGYLGGLQLIGEDMPMLRATLTSCLAAVFDGSSLVFLLLRAATALLQSDLSLPSVAWSTLCATAGVAFYGLLRAPDAPPPRHSLATLTTTSTTEIEMVGEMEFHSEVAPRGEIVDTMLPRVAAPVAASTRYADLEASAEVDHRTMAEAAAAAAAAAAEAAATVAVVAATPASDAAVVAAEGGGAAPRTLGATLLATENMLLVCFMSVYNCVSSFYVETQIDQFESRFGATDALRLSSVFNLAFPIGGLLAALPTSALLRHAGTRPHVYWGVTAGLASCFALLSLLPSYGAQLCAALMFGPIRCLQWACYFQLLADERRYPPHLTGRALGYNNSLVALMGDLLPYLFTFLAASEGWGGDLNGRYLRIKAGLLLLLLLLVLPTAAVVTRQALRLGARPPPKLG